MIWDETTKIWSADLYLFTERIFKWRRCWEY